MRALRQGAGRVSWLQRAWARIRGVAHPEPPPRPADLIHFSPDGQPLPLCGARYGSGGWAINFEAVTCPACRDQGWPIVLQYRVNTR